MFANETFLGVKPSSEYLFIVIASSVGSYFKTDAPAVSLWVSQEFTRAAPGGTGAALGLRRPCESRHNNALSRPVSQGLGDIK